VKYYSRIGSSEYEIEIIDGKVLVDGEAVDVDMRQSGAPELYSLLYNGRSFEILIEEDERTRRLNVGRKMVSLPEGELAITAPIPGLVVKILVEVGQSVKDEQPLVLLEAMKMENEIRAVRDGVVKSIGISAGERVLVVLE
jgi:biotin carboxyl carrier protein